MNKPALGALIASLALSAMVTAAPRQVSAALPGESLYQLDLLLQDSAGRPVQLSSLRGRPLLITLFYSHCTSICPMITLELQDLYRQLTSRQQARLRVLMVSLDAKRDAPEELQAFKEQHAIHEEGWIIARAKSGDVRVLAAVLGVRYRELSDGSFNHSAVIVAADSQGVIRGRTSELTVADPAFVDLVRRLTAPASASRAAGE